MNTEGQNYINRRDAFMAKYVMALDAGTTSNRAIIFDEESRIVGVSQKEFTQHFPEPGWVEHDAEEIWSSMVTVMREALEKANLTAGSLSAIGITNQRETTVVWDKNTGRPVYNAIVWQYVCTAIFLLYIVWIIPCRMYCFHIPHCQRLFCQRVFLPKIL